MVSIMFGPSWWQQFAKTNLSLIKIRERGSVTFGLEYLTNLKVAISVLFLPLNMLGLTSLMLNVTAWLRVLVLVGYNHPRTGQIFLKSFVLQKFAHSGFLEGIQMGLIGFIEECSLQTSREGCQFFEFSVLIRRHAFGTLQFLRKLQHQAFPENEADAWILSEFFHLMLDITKWPGLLIMVKLANHYQFTQKVDMMWNVWKFYALSLRFNKLLWFDNDDRLRMLLQCLMLSAFGEGELIEEEHIGQCAIPLCNGEAISCLGNNLVAVFLGHLIIHYKFLAFTGNTSGLVMKQKASGKWCFYSNIEKLEADGFSLKAQALHDKANQNAFSLKFLKLHEVLHYMKRWLQNRQDLFSAELVILSNLELLMFSLPRPPEIANLEGKVFEGGRNVTYRIVG